MEIDLHLDQKKPQYKGARAHNGEYDGPVVEREIARIAGWVKHLHNALPVRSDAIRSNPPNLKKESGTAISHQQITNRQKKNIKSQHLHLKIVNKFLAEYFKEPRRVLFFKKTRAHLTGQRSHASDSCCRAGAQA